MQMFYIQRLLLASLGLFMLIRTSETVAQPMPSLQGVVDVAGSKSSTCVLMGGGGVKCWGANDHGQLGDGSLIPSLLPVDVVGLANRASLLSMKGDGQFACALTTAGSAKCWGENWSGQLGDGTTVNRLAPVTVSGLDSGVTSISTGATHACALTSAGGVKCWGWNAYGQLGDGTTTRRLTPVDVAGLTSGVVAIGGGDLHSCAILDSGALKCWGHNNSGQLGDGTTADRAAPVAVSGLTAGVVAVDGGLLHSCARTFSGAIKCWGDNAAGQVGVGWGIGYTVPMDVSGLSNGITAIKLGTYYSCAVKAGDGVWCWGSNANGQFGIGSLGMNHPIPARLGALEEGVWKLGAGQDHLCAVTPVGRVKCAGDNWYGQLGDGNRSIRPSPVDAEGLNNGVVMVDGGNSSTCAVAGGGAKCWGENGVGQLGDGSTTRRVAAVNVAGLSSGVAAISAGTRHACALTVSGGAKCWGSGGNGELGDGASTQRLTPVDVFGLLSGVGAIAAGHTYTCAVETLGGVKCWGWNGAGQLGDGTTTTRSTPVAVMGLGGSVIAISVGDFHACALTNLGGVKCWGNNSYGQLGNGTMSSSPTPVDVIGLTTGVDSVRAGSLHTCALMTAGGVKCWGYNGSGALGDDSYTDRSIPVDVGGLTSGVTAIGTGAHHTCVAMAANGAKCWGGNWFGQLGDGTTAPRPAPVSVAGLTGRIEGLTGGWGHTCALIADGGLKCWGDNIAGQLGVGGRDYTRFDEEVLAGNSIFANGFD